MININLIDEVGALITVAALITNIVFFYKRKKLVDELQKDISSLFGHILKEYTALIENFDRLIELAPKREDVNLPIYNRKEEVETLLQHVAFIQKKLTELSGFINRNNLYGKKTEKVTNNIMRLNNSIGKIMFDFTFIPIKDMAVLRNDLEEYKQSIALLSKIFSFDSTKI